MQAVLNEGREPLIGAAGLGLRILGRILRLHELRSWVETAPGGGSRVTIEIPAAAEVASAARRLQS
jgi:signal transduction histidine kinase